MKKLNQHGAIDLTFMLVVIGIIGVGSFAYWRVQNSNPPKTRSTDIQVSEQKEALPSDISSIKTLDEVKQLAGANTDSELYEVELEEEDEGLVYKVTLRSGKTLKINALTGEILDEGTTTLEPEDEVPAGTRVALTFAQAYDIAKSKSASPIARFRLKLEDGKLVYRADYRNGSRLELDATNGAVVKQELKGVENADDSEDNDSADESSDDSNTDDVDGDDEDEVEDDSSNSGSGSNR